MFGNRISLTPLPFSVVLAGTLLIAVLTVSGQVWRASHVRPAEVLCYE